MLYSGAQQSMTHSLVDAAMAKDRAFNIILRYKQLLKILLRSDRPNNIESTELRFL
ncbi:hypothetical protein LINGRAHAP2_LOCUS8954 [Linum grandiflorum]